MRGSSSGDVGSRYGKNDGTKVDTSHERMLANAAINISGSWPRMVLFLANLLSVMVGVLGGWGGDAKKEAICYRELQLHIYSAPWSKDD